MVKEILKRCPKCGNLEVEFDLVDTQSDTDWNYFFVVCRKCGHGGSTRRTLAEAIEAWNTRYELSTPGSVFVPVGNERLHDGI